MRRVALALAVAVVAGLASPAAAPARYFPLGAFGSPGTGRAEFGPPRPGYRAFRIGTSPAGIAFAGRTVLVADALNHRVQRFTRTGRYLGSFGRKGVRPGGARMLAPHGLVAHRGRVFVAMNGNDRVDVFSRGRWRRMFHVRSGVHRRFGTSRGAGRGQLHNPYGIARAPSGHFYVADLLNSRVNRYDARGRSRGQIGGFGKGPGQFLAPFGVAVDRAGNVWVSDRELNRVQKFSPSGQLLLAFGQTGGVAPGGYGRGRDFLSPQGIAVDRLGNLYVADLWNAQVHKYAPDGTPLDIFGRGLLTQPTYVALDEQCRAYVSDYRRVVIFAPAGGC